MKYQSPSTYHSKDTAKVKNVDKHQGQGNNVNFFGHKVNFLVPTEVKRQGQKFLYTWKALSQGILVKYQSPRTYHSKVVAKVKVFG
jgi:hypothetical protein